MSSDATSLIYELGTIFVAVSDQERALEFYTRTLGFEKRADFLYGGGHRWIELAPPGAKNTISLVPPGEGRAEQRFAAHCAFATTDIDALHAALVQAGVEVDAAVAGAGTDRTGLTAATARVADPQPRQFLFCDPDGNRFLVVQP